MVAQVIDASWQISNQPEEWFAVRDARILVKPLRVLQAQDDFGEQGLDLARLVPL